MPTLQVPFSLHGCVEIEATQEEFESPDATVLYGRAETALNQITLDDLDHPEIFMVDAEFIDD